LQLILISLSLSWLELSVSPKFTHQLEVISLTEKQKILPWTCSKIDFINREKTFMVLLENSWYALEEIDSLKVNNLMIKELQRPNAFHKCSDHRPDMYNLKPWT